MSKINIPDRICSHCGGTLWYKQITRKGEKLYTVYYCVKKTKDRAELYHKTNREKILLKNKQNKDKHKIYPKEKWAEWGRKYRRKYKDRINARRRELYILNRRKKLEEAKTYRDTHSDQIKKNNSKFSKKYIDELGNNYIKNLMQICVRNTLGDGKLLDRSAITKEQIEMYRQSLLVQRQLKQLRNNQKAKYEKRRKITS